MDSCPGGGPGSHSPFLLPTQAIPICVLHMEGAGIGKFLLEQLHGHLLQGKTMGIVSKRMASIARQLDSLLLTDLTLLASFPHVDVVKFLILFPCT